MNDTFFTTSGSSPGRRQRHPSAPLVGLPPEHEDPKPAPSQESHNDRLARELLESAALQATKDLRLAEHAERARMELLTESSLTRRPTPEETVEWEDTLRVAFGQDGETYYPPEIIPVFTSYGPDRFRVKANFHPEPENRPWETPSRETTQSIADITAERTRLRLKYNPTGEARLEVDESEVMDHPDFLADATRFHVVTTNTPLEELAGTITPNTLSQRFTRLGSHKKLDFTEVKGWWFCVVLLNDQPYIKKLARLDADPYGLTVFRKWEEKKKESKTSAKKEEKRKPSKATQHERVLAAHQRIERAYANTWVFNGDLFPRMDSDTRAFFRAIPGEERT